MQLEYGIGAAIALLVAIVSAIGEHRRRRRRDLDRVGMMPWLTIQMAALFAALLLVSLALHAG